MTKQVPENPEKNREFDETYTVAVSIFVALYLISNLLAVRIIVVGDLALFDAGTLLFPFSYMLGDVLADVWGYRGARRTVILAIFCQMALIAFTLIVTALPAPSYGQEMKAAFDTVFSYVPRLVLASIAAFLVGSLVNAKALVLIKQWHDSRLWVRTIGSSVAGHFVDTLLFVVIAFAGVSPLRDLWTMIAIQYVFKLLVEAVAGTPLAYLVIGRLRKRTLEG